MPRPERPINASEGPIEGFAAALRALRAQTGNPPYRDLAELAHYSKATLSEAAAGHRLPTWEVTSAYVRACGADPDEWLARWQEARSAVGPLAAPGPPKPPDPVPQRVPGWPRALLAVLVLVAGGACVVLIIPWSSGHPSPASSGSSGTPTQSLGRFIGGTEPIADNNDPKKTGCAYEPQVATLDQVEVNTIDEHYLGDAELRHSPQCGVAWGRFTPSAAMKYLKNATVTIEADRPATNTTGIAYRTHFDGQAVFGNILTEQHGCVQIKVVVRSATVQGSAATACKP